MARQKPVPQHVVAAEEDKEEKTKESPESSNASSLGDDDDIPEDTPESLCAQGLQLESINQLDDAIQYFEWAVRKKVLELSKDSEEAATVELKPEMGVFWLRYGDALFSRLEQSEELFGAKTKNPEEPEVDDSQLAWEALETARVCFGLLVTSQKLIHANPKIPDMADWLADTENAEEPWSLCNTYSEEHMKILRLQAYCRMRLGDYKLGFQEYQDAIVEFWSSLQICAEYGLEYNKGLEAALPLAQCLMAIESSYGVNAFRVCLRLIDAEKKHSNPSSDRLRLLDLTYEDLTKQLAEYEQVREGLKNKVREAIEHVQGVYADELPRETVVPEGAELIDLGVVSKRRRKEEPRIEGGTSTPPHLDAFGCRVDDSNASFTIRSEERIGADKHEEQGKEGSTSAQTNSNSPNSAGNTAAGHTAAGHAA